MSTSITTAYPALRKVVWRAHPLADPSRCWHRRRRNSARPAPWPRLPPALALCRITPNQCADFKELENSLGHQ